MAERWAEQEAGEHIAESLELKTELVCKGKLCSVAIKTQEAKTEYQGNHYHVQDEGGMTD